MKALRLTPAALLDRGDPERVLFYSVAHLKVDPLVNLLAGDVLPTALLDRMLVAPSVMEVADDQRIDPRERPLADEPAAKLELRGME